jgi:hypothetical protein
MKTEEENKEAVRNDILSMISGVNVIAAVEGFLVTLAAAALHYR